MFENLGIKIFEIEPKFIDIVCFDQFSDSRMRALISCCRRPIS